MHASVKTVILAAATCVVPLALQAQFTIAGHQVQIHGFASQGFGYSDDNNYLTMKTSNGSFAMTDGGLNASSQITDKFRVGAQIYDRNIGELGKWRPQLDWAFGDYKFKDWFGIRAGKVKTTLGLFNDTQDTESLHTWALLPQSMYPVDLRAATIAHTGGDLYGDISLKQLGTLSYTAYAGIKSSDMYGGRVYASTDYGWKIADASGSMRGADLRWTPPVSGLVVGISALASPSTLSGTYKYLGATGSGSTDFQKDNTVGEYFDYSRGKLRVFGEYRRELTHLVVNRSGSLLLVGRDARSWYTAASYRIAKRLELGTYHSRFYSDWGQLHGDPNNHIFDQVATARVDLTGHWNVKIEGHFMDGHGAMASARGFYLRSNPAGLQPNTNLLVVRTGFNF